MNINDEAERAVLGSLMARPEVATEVFGIVEPHMFAAPRHGLVAGAVLDLYRRSLSTDPQSVLQVLMERGLVTRPEHGVELFELWARTVAAVNAPLWARLVREAWQQREFAVGVGRLHQMVENPDLSLSEAITSAVDVVDRAIENKALTEPLVWETVIDVMAATYPRNVLIPGLLNRMDRYLYTGSEGLGKTEWQAMIVCCAVAGYQPFTGELFEPLRVQVIDAENSRQQSTRRYTRITGAVDRIMRAKGKAVDWSNLWMQHRPEGLSLLDQKNVDWLRSGLDVSRPDLLAIGSLYKLYRGANVNDETAAGQVTNVFDQLRTDYGCALFIEAHMAKGGDVSGNRTPFPRGSSAFMGWPEFGHSLTRAKDDVSEDEYPQRIDVVRWRGSRVPDATWPTKLRRGPLGGLPWLVDDARVEGFAPRSAYGFR